MDCGELPHNISVVKCKSVKVCDIRMNVEPIHYNKGCYSIDLTYVFNIELYAYEKSCDSPCVLTGKALACKSCILYGGESNTKTFFSKETNIGKPKPCCEVANLPIASVQVVDPIALATKIEKVCSFDGPDSPCCYKRTVIMTLGLFSVVELSRPATILVQHMSIRFHIRNARLNLRIHAKCLIEFASQWMNFRNLILTYQQTSEIANMNLSNTYNSEGRPMGSPFTECNGKLMDF